MWSELMSWVKNPTDKDVLCILTLFCTAEANRGITDVDSNAVDKSILCSELVILMG